MWLFEKQVGIRRPHLTFRAPAGYYEMYPPDKVAMPRQVVQKRLYCITGSYSVFHRFELCFRHVSEELTLPVLVL